MKRYQEKKGKKSWSIKLDFNVDVALTAVDSYTGKHICRLIYFNPYEHHNTFDSRGALIIE